MIVISSLVMQKKDSIVFSLKKALGWILGCFALYALGIGVKVVLFAETAGMTDLKLLLTGFLGLVFVSNIAVNLFLTKTSFFKNTNYIGILLSVMAIFSWTLILNAPGDYQEQYHLHEIAMLSTVFTFAITNFSIVNLAQKRHIFAPLFIIITKLICIIFALYLAFFILGFLKDNSITIKGLTIAFMALCYCDFMIIILHILGLRHRNRNALLLLPTDTAGVYIDKNGNQFLVKQINNAQLTFEK